MSDEKEQSENGRRNSAYGYLLEYVERHGWVYDNGVFWEDQDTHLRRLDFEKEVVPRLWEVYLQLVEPSKESFRKFEDHLKGVQVSITRGTEPHPRFLNLANGILDLESKLLLPHGTAQMKFKYFLPVEFETGLLPEPPQPTTWCRLLEQHIPAKEDRDLLESWLGYAMTDDRSIPQMLVLFGPAATGKSTVLNFFTELMGPELIAHESVKTVLSEPAFAANIIGRRVSIATEVGISLRDLERFKSLLSFEGVQVHEYYRGKRTVPSGCKFVCATNNEAFLPSFPEIERRVRVVEFGNPIPSASQEARMLEHLLGESREIFHRLLAAYLRFRGKTSFPLNASTKRYLSIANENVNPVVAWASDRELSPGPHWVPVAILYQIYKRETDDDRMSIVEFGRKLSDAGIRENSQRDPRRLFRAGNQTKRFRGREINKPLWNGTPIQVSGISFRPAIEVTVVEPSDSQGNSQ